MRRRQRQRPGSLPLAALTATEQHLIVAARRPGDPFEPGGLAAHWSAKTWRTVLRRYCVYRAWFDRTYGSEFGEVDPALRFTAAALEQYYRWRRPQVAAVTLAGEFRDLREVLRVMCPSADLRLLTRLVSRLAARARAGREKDARMRHSRDVALAGMRAMAAAEADPTLTPTLRAARFRDGLIVALLAFRPVRLENLVALSFERHLFRLGGVWRIRIEPEELKDRGGVALDFPVPEELGPWFEQYCEVHRPQLLRGRVSDRLWISTRRTPLSSQAAWQAISVTTERQLGVAINPHLFRDCAATSIALDEPAQIEIVARILGHRCLKTGERYYLRARMAEASQHYTGQLLQRRQRAGAELHDQG